MRPPPYPRRYRVDRTQTYKEPLLCPRAGTGRAKGRALFLREVWGVGKPPPVEVIQAQALAAAERNAADQRLIEELIRHSNDLAAREEHERTGARLDRIAARAANLAYIEGRLMIEGKPREKLPIPEGAPPVGEEPEVAPLKTLEEMIQGR